MCLPDSCCASGGCFDKRPCHNLVWVKILQQILPTIATISPCSNHSVMSATAGSLVFG